jgi:hypothetical protein
VGLVRFPLALIRSARVRVSARACLQEAEERYATVAASQFFLHFDEAELRRFALHFRMRVRSARRPRGTATHDPAADPGRTQTYPSGAVVRRKGQLADTLFIIREGEHARVQVRKGQGWGGGGRSGCLTRRGDSQARWFVH